jgi:hypothetical protein
MGDKLSTLPAFSVDLCYMFTLAHFIWNQDMDIDQLVCFQGQLASFCFSV